MKQINMYNVFKQLQAKMYKYPKIDSPLIQEEIEIADVLYEFFLEVANMEENLIPYTLDSEDAAVAEDNEQSSLNITEDAVSQYYELKKLGYNIDEFLEPLESELPDDIPLKRSMLYVDYEKEVKAVNYWRGINESSPLKRKKCRTFEQVQNKFKFVLNRMIYI